MERMETHQFIFGSASYKLCSLFLSMYNKDNCPGSQETSKGPTVRGTTPSVVALGDASSSLQPHRIGYEIVASGLLLGRTWADLRTNSEHSEGSLVIRQ